MNLHETRPASDADTVNGSGPALDRLEQLTEEASRLSQTARRWIDEYPLLTLGAVVVAGYVAGRMMRR